MSSVTALVRWAIGKRLTYRLPKLSFLTPSRPEPVPPSEGTIDTEAEVVSAAGKTLRCQDNDLR